MRLDEVGIASVNVSDIHGQSPTKKKNHKQSDILDQGIHKDKVETVVSQLNGFIEPLQTNLQFKLHEELNEYYVTVVNPLTNEVIKEIPPKKMLDMYAEMAQFMGILIDEKI